MSGQTSLNGTKAPAEETPAGAVARNTGEFLHDLVTLGELQFRLLVIDGREGIQGIIAPLVTLVIGLTLAVATVPVALLALAAMLVELYKFTPAQGAGIAAGVGAVLALLFVAFGYWSLRSPRGNAFERSTREWRQNLRWIKDAIQKTMTDRSRSSTATPPRYSHN